MEKEYKVEWKVLDLKYQKSDGLVLEVEYQISVELDGVVKTKTDISRLRKSKDVLPLEKLTEKVVLNWIKNDNKDPFRRSDSIIRQLKTEVDKELVLPTKNGLPWKK